MVEEVVEVEVVEEVLREEAEVVVDEVEAEEEGGEVAVEDFNLAQARNRTNGENRHQTHHARGKGKEKDVENPALVLE